MHCSLIMHGFHNGKWLVLCSKCCYLISSISNKDVLFIFPANKVAAEEVPLWIPLEQKVVKDVHRLSSSTYLHNCHKLEAVCKTGALGANCHASYQFLQKKLCLLYL